MSVASRNPFQLLGEDGEEFSPAAAPAAAKVPAAATQAPRNIPGSGQKNAARGPQANRGGARTNTRGAETGAEGDAQQKDSRRGVPRGESRGRGGRGRGGREGGRGRAYDRHSQTDRVDSQKNLHQGWGGDDPKRELDAEKKAESDAKAEGTKVNGAATLADAEAQPEKVEEEDKTLTLDEYLAAQAEKRANLGAPKPREIKKDDSAWSAFGVKVEKKSGDDYFAATKAEKTRVRAQKEGKQLLEIEQRFDQPAVASRGRGAPRGGRGGDRASTRGNNNRGARGGRGGNNASVNLADKSAFPSLS